MSVSVTEDPDPRIRIGNKCPKNGKATVSVEVVMTEEQRKEMMEQLAAGEAVVQSRQETVEALGLVRPEEER